MCSRILVTTAACVVLVIGLWTAGSWYIVRDVQTPHYEVIANSAEYEVRRYPRLLVAETRSDKTADADGLFRVLANFIFGDNRGGDEIAMTAPVLIAGGSASFQDGAPATMQFIMPETFTRATLPTPNDARVRIREIESRVVAARQFGWFAGINTQREHKRALLDTLQRHGVKVVGKPIYAAYQPPFSVPILKRHEILVEIEIANGS